MVSNYVFHMFPTLFVMINDGQFIENNNLFAKGKILSCGHVINNGMKESSIDSGMKSIFTHILMFIF